MVQVIRKSNKAAYAKLDRLGRDIDGIELKVGWFATDIYNDEEGTSVASVAAANEFGVPASRIPARPFMRPTVARMESFWRRLIKSEVKKIPSGGTTIKNMFDVLGLMVAGEIRRSITMVYNPPLSPVTIALRKAKMADKTTEGDLSKPLVDTRNMITSVNHIVEDGN